MEQLDELTATRIASFLSRRDCVYWSRCCKQLYELVSKCCYLRLTEKQVQVIDRVLALRASGWSVNRQHQFNPGFVVATGTSTGKTLISLVCAKQIVLRGQRVLHSVEARLLTQWIGEYEKFAEPLALPPLVIVEKGWLRKYRAHRGQCLVVSSRFYVSPRNARPSHRELTRELHSIGWHVVLCDDVKTVPYLIEAMPGCYGVTFNASMSTSTQNNHQMDAELGSLPELDVSCFHVAANVGCQPIDKRELEIHHLDTGYEAARFTLWRPKDQAFWTAEMEQHYARLRETYSYWLALCSGEKTLVVTSDETTIARRPKRKVLGFRLNRVSHNADEISMSSKAESVLNIDLFDDSVSVVRAIDSPKTKQNKIAEFQAASRGTLVCSAHYISRGFNLPCDTLIVMDLDGKMSSQVLLQVVGRVRRVQTRHQRVRCCLISSSQSLWTLFAFLNEPTTKLVLEKAKCNTPAEVLEWRADTIHQMDNCISFIVPSK